ncbi:MAG: hypothetical protein IJO63_05600 [Bacilli bacterium]|nr:hypothetical protein [Bacilli bacterium]
MKKKTQTKKKVKNKLQLLYIIMLVIAALSVICWGYAFIVYLYIYWLMLIVTPLYLIAECFIDTGIKDKTKNIILGIFDFCLGMLLFWNPVYVSLKIYDASSMLYIILGIIFCAFSIVKKWISKTKFDYIKWIRFITRILFLIAFILILESCSSSGGL